MGDEAMRLALLVILGLVMSAAGSADDPIHAPEGTVFVYGDDWPPIVNLWWTPPDSLIPGRFALIYTMRDTAEAPRVWPVGFRIGCNAPWERWVKFDANVDSVSTVAFARYPCEEED
jgi:hypothetical protein